jgi:hypothetical protein
MQVIGKIDKLSKRRSTTVVDDTGRGTPRFGSRIDAAKFADAGHVDQGGGR